MIVCSLPMWFNLKLLFGRFLDRGTASLSVFVGCIEDRHFSAFGPLVSSMKRSRQCTMDYSWSIR